MSPSVHSGGSLRYTSMSFSFLIYIVVLFLHMSEYCANYKGLYPCHQSFWGGKCSLATVERLEQSCARLGAVPGGPLPSPREQNTRSVLLKVDIKHLPEFLKGPQSLGGTSFELKRQKRMSHLLNQVAEGLVRNSVVPTMY